MLNVLYLIQVDRNFGPRAPGKGVRAQRATKTKGPRSIIASEPMGMIKQYPDLKYENQTCICVKLMHMLDYMVI